MTTTVSQPMRLIGERAARRLVDHAHGPDAFECGVCQGTGVRDRVDPDRRVTVSESVLARAMAEVAQQAWDVAAEAIERGGR